MSALANVSDWAIRTLTSSIDEMGPPPFGDRDKRKDLWFTQFWDPIYRAVCSMPHSEYNKTVSHLEGLARQVVTQRGIDFAPNWYGIRKSLALPEKEYLEQREELGCAQPKKLPLGLLVVGGAAVAGATVLVTLALTKPKKRGRR